MKNKRIFAVTYAKSHNHNIENCGIFYAQAVGVYCIYTHQHRLLSFIVTTVFRYLVGLLAERKTAVFFYISPILYELCQESKVSGLPKSTVSAILRQQRDSLHRIRNSRSRECQIRGTRISSGSPSASSSSSIMRSTSASSISTGRRSVFRSSSPPPE